MSEQANYAVKRGKAKPPLVSHMSEDSPSSKAPRFAATRVACMNAKAEGATERHQEQDGPGMISVARLIAWLREHPTSALARWLQERHKATDADAR